MKFTKPELQSMRSMITKKLSESNHLLRLAKDQRKMLFWVSDKEDPTTFLYYVQGKKISNLIINLEKELDSNTLLLRKVKDMIQIVDGKIPKSKMRPKKKMFQHSVYDTND